MEGVLVVFEDVLLVDFFFVDGHGPIKLRQTTTRTIASVRFTQRRNNGVRLAPGGVNTNGLKTCRQLGDVIFWISLLSSRQSTSSRTVKRGR
jgi:hypothetical protein